MNNQLLHTEAFTINIAHISQILWNHGIIEGSENKLVVAIDILGDTDSLYLYYSDEQDLKAIRELKELVKYPYSLPTGMDTISE